VLYYYKIQHEPPGAMGQRPAIGNRVRGITAHHTGIATAAGTQDGRGCCLHLRDVQQIDSESNSEDPESLHARRRLRESSARLVHQESARQAEGTRREQRTSKYPSRVRPSSMDSQGR